MAITKTVHVDLAPEGFEGSWLELHDPKYLPQNAFDELVERFRSLSTEDADAKAKGEAFLRERLAAWHVEYEYQGQTISLSDPAKDDLGLMPRGVAKVLTDKIVELLQATVPLALRRT